jgi:hypothetical protein
MTLGIRSFDIEMHLGYLSLQAGSGAQRWDILWSHHAREFVVCRGMRTIVAITTEWLAWAAQRLRWVRTGSRELTTR